MMAVSSYTVQTCCESIGLMDNDGFTSSASEKISLFIRGCTKQPQNLPVIDAPGLALAKR